MTDTTAVQEIWKLIPDLPDYEVSNHGRVRRATAGRKTYAGRIIKPSLDRKNGYLKLRGAGISKSIHRLVALAFIPSVDGKPFVNHIDGNKQNNHVSNLEWVTRRENAVHSVRLGLQPILKGSQQAMSKLTEADVLIIRSLFKPNYMGLFGSQWFAVYYGVDAALISRVADGRSWKHVPMIGGIS